MWFFGNLANRPLPNRSKRQGLSRPQWSQVRVTQSCLTLSDPMDYSSWDSPGQNTGVGSFSLLQGIFPTQGSNPGLSHYRWILYHLSYEGSPSPSPTKKEKTKHCLLGTCGKVELISWKVDLLDRKISSAPAVFSGIEFAEFMTSYRVTSYYWWTHQAPLSKGFPRQEYWSGLPFHSPGDLPDPGIELMSPALADGFFTIEPPGKP